MAYRIAESAGATEFAEPELRNARVSLESMEELLRRNMPLDVVLPYVNDSIRLSALAARTARTQAIRNELAEETRRAELLEQQNLQIEQELQRLDQKARGIRTASERVEAILSNRTEREPLIGT